MLWLVSFLFLLFPCSAYAWAPATHLFFAKEVLHFGHLLPAALQELLTTYRLDFFYGSIAADITIGKAYVEHLYNCHNFKVAFNLLDHAKNPAEEAFVHGYIGHLAADTVSHNFFVPYQNIEHLETRGKFRHAYWEVRLDEYFGERVWEGVEEIIRNPRTHGHDRLLDGALKDTIFSFRTNKILFSSMLAIQRLKKWQQFVKGINRVSQLQFNPHHVAEYNRLAISAMIRMFSEKENSPVFKVDPTGREMIGEAIQLRSELKRLEKAKELTPKYHQEQCLKFRNLVRKTYFSEYEVNDPDFHPSIEMKL